MTTKIDEQLARLKHYVSADDVALPIVQMAQMVADRVKDDFPREAAAVKAQLTKKEPTERDCDEFVRREVLCCLSGLVSTLAEGMGEPITAKPLRELCELAFELSAPVDDWEEAAFQAGWTGPHKDQFGVTFFQDKTDGKTWACSSRVVGRASAGEELAREFDLDPYQWEVYEHWAVTPYFADKLEAQGEKVEKDFFGLCVWARTTTGQGISQDGVIKRIVAEAFNA